MTLIQTFLRKATLKQEVFYRTQEVFGQFRKEVTAFVARNGPVVARARFPLLFEFTDRGDFQFELKFGSDVLLFLMHTNVFEIPRDHEIMKHSYIHDDKRRSYCGHLMIYNFLADSFKYRRQNDMGYLIGRILVNREKHYFIEGKRELGMLYNNFPTSVINVRAIRAILDSAVRYSLNFDLLMPPFDQMKEVTVQEMQNQLDTMSLRTGKRIGYRFSADVPGEDKQL